MTRARHRHYLREWRVDKGLTLEQLATKARTQKSVLSRIENGKRGLETERLFRLANVLNIAPGLVFSSPAKVKRMTTVEIHSPPNTRPIDEIYVFMSIDEAGNHGILASILPNLGSTPLFTGSKQGAENLKPIAAQIARASKKKIGLFLFKRVEQTWSLEGEKVE